MILILDNMVKDITLRTYIDFWMNITCQNCVRKWAYVDPAAVYVSSLSERKDTVENEY